MTLGRALQRLCVAGANDDTLGPAAQPPQGACRPATPPCAPPPSLACPPAARPAGYVQTDMTGGQGWVTVGDSSAGIMRLLEDGRPLNGRWYSYNGDAIEF